LDFIRVYLFLCRYNHHNAETTQFDSLDDIAIGPQKHRL